MNHTSHATRYACPYCGARLANSKAGHCGESSAHMLRVRPVVGREDPIVGGYYAIDDSRYDGAPDGDRTAGHGATPEAAILDLMERYLS